MYIYMNISIHIYIYICCMFICEGGGEEVVRLRACHFPGRRTEQVSL